ncbi:MAG: hyalin [Planctomycetes bacterium]|nr:hyalin [Planctomycetota bacterium]
MISSRPSRLQVEELESRTLFAASLALDINPGASGSNPGGSSLSLETNIGGLLFFGATDGTHGRELWKSDGTAANTVLVKDINPGAGDSNPSRLTNVNGTLFFRADDGVNGPKLWKSDGTAAGTGFVQNLDPSYLTNVNGTLYFRANDGAYGYELWKSDGTAAGTVMVKDINPGSTSSSPQYLTNVNGTLFFRANDGTNGSELWKSDGTAAGTVLVKDIRSGASGSSAQNLTNVNGTLFFRANDGMHGYELWKSNGTSAGTVLVKDITPGATGYLGYGPDQLTNVNGTLFFETDDGIIDTSLWKSDGTEAGTVLVKDIASTQLVAVGNTLFFNGDVANQLWKSDGTLVGTVPVKTIGPAIGDPGPQSLTNVNGTLFFRANNGVTGGELWQSNGTAAGTVLVKDINPGASSSDPNFFFNANGTLFLSANDGTHGNELWSTASGGTTTSAISAIGGADGSVRIVDANTGSVLATAHPLDTGGVPYTGLVQVALGDFNGDAVPDLLVAAANPSGAAGLNAAKAGKVFVYDGASLAKGTVPATPFRTFTPFATTDGPAGSSGAFINGLNIATGDVNGDGTVDLIAGSRGGNGSATGGLIEYGRLVVIDGSSPAGSNNVIGGIQKPFGASYQKGVVVAAGDVDGVGGVEIAVTRGGPVASSNPTVQQIKVKVLQLQGGALTELHLSADGSTSFAPFGGLSGAAKAINRDGRVTFVDSNGDGKAELVFSALDPLTNAANKQVRVGVFLINVAATSGAATIVSTGSDAGTYLTGSAVVDHAITHVAGTGNQKNLALATESASSGVVYLAPLTGAVLTGGFSLTILHGGISIDGI